MSWRNARPTSDVTWFDTPHDIPIFSPAAVAAEIKGLAGAARTGSGLETPAGKSFRADRSTAAPMKATTMLPQKPTVPLTLKTQPKQVAADDRAGDADD